MKKPGAGPSSRLSDQQIVYAVRRYYLERANQAEIANEFKISPSYLARLIKGAVDSGLVTLSVTSTLDDQLLSAKAVLPTRGQLAVAVDGTRVAVAIDLASAQPQSSQIRVGGGKITITVDRD